MSQIARSWRSFLHRHHALDYLGLLILASANTIMFIDQEPFHRMFSLDDRKLQFPHAEHERVPVPMLLVLSILIPLGTIIAWSLTLGKGAQFLTVSVLGLSGSLMLTNFLTDFVKNFVGSPRPDLISRCIPQKGTPTDILVTHLVCTQTDHHTLEDGFRSFPSGHSSFSFAGLLYLSLFLSGQLHIFRPGSGADLTRVCVVLAPSVLAGMITMSRLEDYRHDYYDVSAGSALGILCAYFAYRRYFPRLGGKGCDVPYEEGEGEGYEKVDGVREGDLEMGDMTGRE